MPLDAICLQAVLQELRPQVIGARIDKVHQPFRDEVILMLRGNLRLLLHAGANAPRIQLTERPRENPAEPPMFCMLLRKHLVGGRITAVSQPGLERLVQLEIAITDDFGRPGKRTLVLEAMGRRSNLILLDGDGRIIDCLRRVDGDMSAQRQVLPGLFYQLPPAPGKADLTQETEEGFFVRLSQAQPEQKLDGFLLDQYFGISPLIARELVCQALGDLDRRIGETAQPELARLWEELCALRHRAETGDFTPTMLTEGGKPSDFSYLPISQYGGRMSVQTYPGFSPLLDDFYELREQQDRLRQRGQDLLRTATTARDRVRRKLALQEKDYAATQNREQLRISGELITANLYRMERGAASLTTENYYDENGGMVTIPLDPLLTPQQNAAHYYKRYNKAKAAERHLLEQMALARTDLSYLESVLEEIRQAETEQDFQEIRSELRDAGYLRRQGKEKKESKRAFRPREFRTSGGLRVLVGRNNRQNDRLTLKDADRRDLWLHTQKIHGAHVILCTGGAEPEETDLREAAMIAAWYSQARESSNVPVDYTPVKYVKKPAGGRPGMVIYSTYRTVYVTPEKDAVEALRQS
jgi:predicted ribosome quality control (RQC) complex YloA/Tae2 family protein